MPATPPTLRATYFDGQSARAQPVELRIHQSVLQIRNGEVALEVPVAQVQWPERTRHGQRIAELPSGGTLQCADGVAWDHWCQASGLAESSVVVAQQSWRWVAAAALAFVVVLGALYQWGLPVLAQGVVALTPYSVDEKIGLATLEAVDDALMQPSELALAQQINIRNAFTRALEAQASDQVPPWNLQFRKSKIGPNALALPGGTLLMTDEMVALVDGDTQVLTAILAHELGHVQHRHGLRMLVQVTALGAVTSLLLGDFSTLLAAVPALLGQANYSRAAEREADAHAVQVLSAAGIAPKVMLTLFDKLEARHQAASKKKAADAPEQHATEAVRWLGIAFASHPANAQRIAFFQDAPP